MNLNQFIGEAERLIRKGSLLHGQGEGDPAAFWHGCFETGPWISVLSQGSWLNVFDVESDSVRVEISRRPLVSTSPLYAEPWQSLPPVDAVFMLGSPAVAEYLKAHDWPLGEPYSSNFPDPVAGEYERMWEKNCPLYQPDIVASTGGWPMPWPDGDWGEGIDKDFLLWTLRDAEPWVEVFRDGDNAPIVKCRIT